VVVVTRDRCDDVIRALRSCQTQSGVDYEVLVYDDASNDGTSERIAADFPDVRLFTLRERQGYIRLRNRGYHDSLGDFLFSLDDDAYFTADDVLAVTVERFDDSPDVAAVAMPYVEPNRQPRLGWMLPVEPGDQLRSYVGCSHAVRKQSAIDIGLYRELYVHQGEERDLCIHLLDAGYRVVYGSSDPSVHLYSPRRDQDRVNYYGYRNTILFSFLNLPLPVAVLRMLIDSAQLLKYRFALSTLPARVWALASGYFSCLRHFARRRPVRYETYRRYRNLPRHGPIPVNMTSHAPEVHEEVFVSR
jgi:glycosyltransferase involved in cell wall biosynthesis